MIVCRFEVRPAVDGHSIDAGNSRLKFSPAPTSAITTEVSRIGPALVGQDSVVSRLTSETHQVRYGYDIRGVAVRPTNDLTISTKAQGLYKRLCGHFELHCLTQTASLDSIAHQKTPLNHLYD